MESRTELSARTPACADGDPRPADQTPDASIEEEGTGLRFEDPYWDDAFCSWWDPRLRSCC